MNVEYFHEIHRDGQCIGSGNVIWKPHHRMNGGHFPATHPCAPGAGGFGHCTERGEMGQSDKLTEMRARGYWFSCFPEGDGVTMKVDRGQDATQVAKDIHEVFGWTVKVKRT